MAETVDEVRNLIVMEQVIDMLPLEVRDKTTWHDLLTTNHSEDEWSRIDHKLV